MWPADSVQANLKSLVLPDTRISLRLRVGAGDDDEEEPDDDEDDEDEARSCCGRLRRAELPTGCCGVAAAEDEDMVRSRPGASSLLPNKPNGSLVKSVRPNRPIRSSSSLAHPTRATLGQKRFPLSSGCTTKDPRGLRGSLLHVLLAIFLIPLAALLLKRGWRAEQVKCCTELS